MSEVTLNLPTATPQGVLAAETPQLTRSVGCHGFCHKTGSNSELNLKLKFCDIGLYRKLRFRPNLV